MQNSDIKQEVLIKGKGNVSVDFVKGIVSFDEDSVILDTDAGKMIVEGIGLRIENLEKATGRIQITGMISGVHYLEKEMKNKGRRLFR